MDALENPDFLGYAHAQEDLTCFDCHDEEETKQMHEEGTLVASLMPAKVKNDFCLGCHVENEHTSWEQIMERTADYTLDGEYINPHDPHPNNPEVGELQCSTCHRNHSESLLIEGCYGCHHERVFDEGCGGIGCHEL